MSFWMVRGDKFGQYYSLALERGFAYHASSVPDLSKVTSREAIMELIRETHPQAKEAQARNWAAQLFAFAYRIKEGDLVAMPLRRAPQIAIGRVKGPYDYRSDLGDIHHTRPVEWIEEDIPRTIFGQDLLYSLGAYMTVCQIQRNNAEARVIEILKGHKDPNLTDMKKTLAGEDETEDAAPTDVEQLARDQILAHLEQNFKGHELARLVEAVLKAEGYVTKLSPHGPDGGVDVLAGRGTLGLEGPRLCVQVKSSQSSADVNVLRALQGSMATFKADQGLLVSWGGFTKSVETEARLSFFTVRLWDANDLMEATLKNYERLSEELRNELPLKRIWALVIEEQ
jgi:restriction system protein